MFRTLTLFIIRRSTS